MTATKALILTWVMIGLLVALAVGFYLGRNTAFFNLGPQGGVQQPGFQQPGLQDGKPLGSPLPPLPTGGLQVQPPKNGLRQPLPSPNQ